MSLNFVSIAKDMRGHKCVHIVINFHQLLFAIILHDLSDGLYENGTHWSESLGNFSTTFFKLDSASTKASILYSNWIQK